MKKSELLSPAGSFESAIAAIQNGSDAIYLGGMRFGARAFANNFDLPQLREVIRYAHAYGVRIYITLNTLIYDQELEDCYEYIDMLYHNQVDALILQDLGMLSYVRSKYPDFEIHASTQMHIINQEALSFLKDMGVKRAVLARETTISEIKSFANQGIELEVFVHGALCVSYSGQCLMSYMVGGRSGNRGACAQSCRMPYTLYDFDKNKSCGKSGYLLSLKDLNTLAHVNELQEVGVDSFKIEGRMKKSEYVAHITSLYRKAIDNSRFEIEEASLKKAKLLFHRGYTDGFLYEQRGSQLYNPYRPNHIGIELGKVLENSKTRIKIQLTEDLYQGDGVRILQDKVDFGFKVNFIYMNDLLVNKAKKGSVVEIECHESIQEGSTLLKTSDPMLEKSIREEYEKIKRRIPIRMYFCASEEKKMKLTVSDSYHRITKESDALVERAKTHPAIEQDIMDKLKKIKDTIFEVEKMETNLKGDLFIPVKILNQLRRDAIEELYEKRATVLKRCKNTYALPTLKPFHQIANISAKVNREEQLLVALEMNIDSIYVQDILLYRKFAHLEQVKLCSARVMKKGYEDVTMIQEIGGISALEHFECDTSLNVCNIQTATFLRSKGATKVCVSWEMGSEDIMNMNRRLKEEYKIEGLLQTVIYGRCEVMVSEHCPMNASMLDNGKKNCTMCRKHTYALQDKFNNLYPMDNDQECRMHLYDYKIMNQLEKAREYLHNNISIRFDFTFESKEETRKILQILKK